MNDLVVHACEQVLRFTSVPHWDDLSEERKVQLAFNVGVVALGLALSKADGYDAIASAVSGSVSMEAAHQHFRAVIEVQNVPISEQNVARAF